jgi:hypothetical protein
MEKKQLEIDFDNAVYERKNTLFNKLFELKGFFETTERIVSSKTSELKKSNKVVLKSIKTDGDLIGLLPSSETILKHFHNLDKLCEISGLSLNDHKESIFLQKFYSFFIKQPNKISKENKEKLLSDPTIIKEVWKLNSNSGTLSDSDFKNLVPIYKIKLEFSDNDVSKIAEKFTTSSLFQRNLNQIIFIHNSISSEVYDFDFINKNIYDLLAVSYIQKSNISKKTVALNINFAYNQLQNSKKIDFEEIFSKTENSKQEAISRKNREIDLEAWLMTKITLGDTKANKLKIAKDTLSVLFTKNYLTHLVNLTIPNESQAKGFEKLLKALKDENLKVNLQKELKI